MVQTETQQLWRSYLFYEERELTKDAPGRSALYNLTRNMAAVTEHANTRGPDDIKT